MLMMGVRRRDGAWFAPSGARNLCGGVVLVGIEGAQAVAAPTGEEIGVADALVFVVLEATGEFQEGAEESGAVIVDQAGFLDEAAELDEVAGAGAAVLDPLAGVVAGAGEIEAVTLHGQALELRCRYLEFLDFCGRIKGWRSTTCMRR
jgi:hypothetical protein